MNLEANLKWYLEVGPASIGRKPNERYSSFDYCFNYFQSFREARQTSSLADHNNVQLSCLQLGFYLASWGMLRGSTELLQKSARHLIPIIEVIATTDASVWDLDVNNYTEPNIGRLCELGDRIRQAQEGMSDILLTKIMLGVFGNVPAFDQNFKRGCKAACICATFGRRALRNIAAFYQRHGALIDLYRVPTFDFVSGEFTHHLYSRAKVIDMILYAQGDPDAQEAIKAAAASAVNAG